MPASPLQSPTLARLAGVRHGFFTREGGVSGGIYTSLNCGPGSQDDPAAVAENRQIAMAALGLEGNALQTLYQVHGRAVVTITGAAGAQRPRADGMATRQRGIALGILTADCAPVLLADAGAQVIGACHAGWKGALAGITDATIEAMQALGARPAKIVAAIGPAIRQASYEVGPEFPGPFLQADAGNGGYFQAGSRKGHFQFDLTGYVGARLRRAGLGEVEDLGNDTRSEAERFFSYRRTTLLGEPDYGRQLSSIALEPDAFGSVRPKG